jgi:hypothetical protein
MTGIRRIDEKDLVLAQVLSSLVDNFDYPSNLEALERTMGGGVRAR